MFTEAHEVIYLYARLYNFQTHNMIVFWIGTLGLGNVKYLHEAYFGSRMHSHVCDDHT